MKFKGAIFDLDGVIVDSVSLHFEAWRKLFQNDFNINFDMEVYEDNVDGKPRLDAIRIMLPNLSEEEVVEAGEIKQGYYLEFLAQGKLRQFKPALRLINELLQNNIKLAAASSSKNTRRILEEIGIIDDFSAIISGFDITHGKPNPEIFLKAAEKINLSVSECVVFEDSIAGLRAAKDGGFISVGVDRHNNPENYKDADLIVKDLSSVNYKTLSSLFSV